MWIYDLELYKLVLQLLLTLANLQSTDKLLVTSKSKIWAYLAYFQGYETYVSLDLIDTSIPWENASPRPVFVLYLM